MPQNRALQAKEQSDFYQRNMGRLLKLIYGLLLIAYLLMGFIIYRHLHQPLPQYFVTTTDGQLIEIKPR